MATKTKAELEAQNAELAARIAELEKKLMGLGEEGKVASTPVNSYVPNNGDVVVVYTSHSMGHMQGSQFNINASVYGEEFTFTRPQFDELVGTYRHWFNDGTLAVSYRNVDVAAAKNLPIDRDNGLTVGELHDLGKMTGDQLEKLWKKVKYDSLRQSICSYYREQFAADVPGYRDRARVDCLNRLTDGAFDYEVQVLGGRPLKLEPIDLVTATE